MGMWLFNQDLSREDTPTPPIETPTQTPEQPNQKKITSPTRTPEAPPAGLLNADYSQLENLLKQGNWKEADQETSKLMLKVAKRESEGWLNIESIENFSCPDLKKIDGLWVKYSNGSFGFSVQKSIIHKEGYDLSRINDFQKYAGRIGWQIKDKWVVYKYIQFRDDAPRGHLPTPRFIYENQNFGFLLSVGRGFSSLAQKIKVCSV